MQSWELSREHMAGKITAVLSTFCEWFTHLGKAFLIHETRQKKKKWIMQIVLQAPEKAETLPNINNQIIWAIMHKECVFEKRLFGMVFCNALLMGA